MTSMSTSTHVLADKAAIHGRQAATMAQVCSHMLTGPFVLELCHRGKGIGGSSAVNFMVYMTPCADDLNGMSYPTLHDYVSSARWPAFERLGNPGFNWQNLSTALRSVEGYVHTPIEPLLCLTMAFYSDSLILRTSTL